MLQVNDASFERVTRSQVDALLEAMRRDELPEPTLERGGDNAGAEKAERAEGGAA